MSHNSHLPIRSATRRLINLRFLQTAAQEFQFDAASGSESALAFGVFLALLLGGDGRAARTESDRKIDLGGEQIQGFGAIKQVN